MGKERRVRRTSSLENGVSSGEDTFPFGLLKYSRRAIERDNEETTLPTHDFLRGVAVLHAPFIRPFNPTGSDFSEAIIAKALLLEGHRIVQIFFSEVNLHQKPLDRGLSSPSN